MDPLTEVISLLQPRTVFSKGISGAGAWAVRYSDFGFPSFCAVLEGSCVLAVDGQLPVILQAGDFILLPTTPGFTMSGFEHATPQLIDSKAAALATGEIRHGRTEGPADVRLLGGYFQFHSPDSALLVSLLPGIVHLRQSKNLPVLVSLINDECQTALAGQDLVLSRLVEVLLIEALRSTATEQAPPGLLRGLADERIAVAIREIHRNPARSWTVAAMAQLSALSRTAFFQRFARTVGVLPMEYLQRWRMALAKDLLKRQNLALTEVADRTGYQSASAFSTAFSRYTGQSPSSYAKEHRLVNTQ